MKKKEFQDLRGKTLKELEAILAKILLELENLRIAIKNKKEKNVHLYLSKRRDLARIKTIISEKKLMEEI